MVHQGLNSGNIGYMSTGKHLFFLSWNISYLGIRQYYRQMAFVINGILQWWAFVDHWGQDEYRGVLYAVPHDVSTSGTNLSLIFNSKDFPHLILTTTAWSHLQCDVTVRHFDSFQYLRLLAKLAYEMDEERLGQEMNFKESSVNLISLPKPLINRFCFWLALQVAIFTALLKPTAVKERNKMVLNKIFSHISRFMK